MLELVGRPGRIGEMALPHRIIMGAMHLGVEDADDGGRALAAFYQARARGGAGLIITGGSAVNRVGAGGRHYSFVNDAEHHDRLALVAHRVHDGGGRIALQLFHAGRYAVRGAFGLQPVAPSAVPSRFSPDPPVALDEDGIAATVTDFVTAATTAGELGFDGVELMGSEGYLLNQFVSPLTNNRDDAWGGDAARRRAFPLAVLRAVRAAVGPEFPIIYRISGADLMPGSTTDAETADLAAALAAGGASALNVGVGWHESAVPTVQSLVPGGTWTPVAARIKRAVGELPVIAGNRINRLQQAEQVLRSGAADFVSMSRPFLADPQLISATRAGRAVNICIGCNQACIDNSLVDAPVSCLVNPAAGHEGEPRPARATAPRRIAVIGGGPAGLSAARELADLGHRVVLFEAEDELGGQFRLARLVPGKADYGETIVFYAAELRRLGVEVRTGVRIGPSNDGLLAGVDGVVLATGVRPRAVDIEGGLLPHVLDYPSAFAVAAGPDLRRLAAGGVAIVGGGGIGVDAAHLISAAGRALDPAGFRAEYGLDAAAHLPDATIGPEPASRRRPATGDGWPRTRTGAVTVMRRSGRIGEGLGRSTRWALIATLRRAGVRLLTGIQYRRITPEGVWIATGDRTELVPATTVVIAAGSVPEASLLPVLATTGLPFRAAGGARSSDRLDAVRAVAEGVGAARELSADLGARAPA